MGYVSSAPTGTEEVFVNSAGGFSAWRVWHRSMRAYKNETLRKKIKQSLRWTFLAAAHPAATRNWLSYLETSHIAPFDRANPLLVFKPYRPYLSASWSFERRLRALRDTYDFASDRVSNLHKALLDPAGLELVRLDIPNYGTVVANLGWDNRYRKEGEFRLLLMARNPSDSFALSFAFERREDGALRCCVGCVQGQAGSKEAFKELTKALHGLRPRSFLIFLLQEIGHSLGVQELVAAGTSIQVRRAQHLVHLSKFHTLEFNYDELWTDVGGEPQQNGWYNLPLESRRRTPLEIASHKRSQYARRYSLLDCVQRQLHSVIVPNEMQNLAV